MKHLTQKIINDTKLLVARDLFSKIIQVPVTIVTARVLGTEDFGLLKMINFIPSLTKFGGLGLGSVVVREISDVKIIKSKLLRSFKRNIAFTYTILWALVLSVIVFYCSLLYDRFEIVWGLRIAAISLFTSQILRLYKVNCKIKKDFKSFAKSDALAIFVGSVFTLSTIYWFGIFSVLIASLLGSFVGCLFLQKKVELNFKPRFQNVELIRQLKIGLPLAMATLFFGLRGWVERLVLLDIWGLNGLGIFMLSLTGIQVINLFIQNTLQAMTVHVYEKLGSRTGVIDTENIVLRPTLTFAVFSSLIGPLILIIGPALIKFFLPQYEPIIQFLPWITVIILFNSISSIYLISMNSVRLSQQVRVIIFQSISILIFIVFCYLFVGIGYQLDSAIISKLIADGCLLVLALFSTKNYLYNNNLKLFINHTSLYLLPFIWSMGSSFIFINLNLYDNIATAIILHFILSIPIIFFWEKRCSILKDFFKLG